MFLLFFLANYCHTLIEASQSQSEDIQGIIADFISDIFHQYGDSNLFGHLITSDEKISATVHKIKDNEKSTITTMLHDMSKEQRQIDNEFKKYGLGFWSKGLDKSVRVYNKDAYDYDRQHLDEEIEKKDFLADLYKNIFDSSNPIFEYDAEDLDMTDVPDDDDIAPDFE